MSSRDSHSHTLEYFCAASSGNSTLPKFFSVAVFDGVQILRYDSKTSRAEPKQEWMKKVFADDPKYWDLESENLRTFHQTYKSRIDTLKDCFNQTGGDYEYNRTLSCKWHDQIKMIDGCDRHGNDREYLELYNPEERICAKAKQQAKITKDEMNQNKAEMEPHKKSLTCDCINSLMMFVDKRRNFLMETELPSVSLFQKNTSSPVSYHGGKEILTALDRNQTRRNWEENPENPSNTVAIVLGVGAVLVSVLVAIAGFIIYKRKRGERTTAGGQP